MYPPTLKYCPVRQCWILNFPRGWHRGTVSPCDCPILPEYAEQLAHQILAGPPLPEPDDEGLVQPAKADHMPAVSPVPYVGDDEEWDADEVIGLAAAIPEKVAGKYTAGSGV